MNGMQGWTATDTVIMVAYIGGVVAFGSMFARGHRDIGDFFLAGRSFRWLPIALSIISAELSGVSYLGAPAMAFQKDLRYALTIFILPVAVIVAVVVIVQIFYRLRVYTVNEYLEGRYGVGIRALAAFLFLLTRGGWLATVIYVPSLALSVVSGWNLTVCVLTMGLLATSYATLGGMKAVIWCDVIQFFVLVGGIMLALSAILGDFRGDIATIWTIASEQGRTRLVSFDWHPTAEFTIWSIIAMGLVVNFGAYGTDQMAVQRYLTARSLRDAIGSAIGQSLLVVPVIISLYLVGTGLVAYYHRHPEMMQALLALSPSNPTQAMDRVFPHFIIYGLPAGISGLVIAGLLAATMSSVDSGVNALATVAVVDFYKRFFHHASKTEQHYLRVGRTCTLAIGSLATLAALAVGQLGTILEIINKITGFLIGPIVALFLLSVFSPRSNATGVFLGTVIGLGTVAYVARYTDVFWLWYGPIGLITSLVAGYAFSLVRPPPPPPE
ncbi:MAG: sodium/solute symporter [Candidatus Hydrogenedentes bacterium]|nr:sodium/solute symporter [Candidatus Hydrogenedentota bacterium]